MKEKGSVDCLHAKKAADQQLCDGDVICTFGQELGRLEGEQGVEALVRPTRLVGMLFQNFLPCQVLELALEDVMVVVSIFFTVVKHVASWILVPPSCTQRATRKDIVLVSPPSRSSPVGNLRIPKLATLSRGPSFRTSHG
jgi:hypothetical protein